MQATLTTDAAPEGKRLDFWRDVVCSTFFLAECHATREGPFHGSISTTATPQIAVSRLRSGAQHVVRNADHVRRTDGEVFLINLQVSGHGGFVQDGREVLLGPGDFTCTDSTRACEMHYTGDFEQVVFYMPRTLVTEARGETDRLTATHVAAESPIGSIVSPFLRQVAAQIRHVQASTAARLAETGMALVMTAFGEMAGGDHDPRRWGRMALRERANQVIDARSCDPDLNPATVAAALGISLRHLQSVFREDGTTPSEWIWRRRLERSRRDLAAPALAAASISTIAYACGFSDVAHFSRRFKAAYGLSPRAFRAGR
ncbi:MAG: helix-turn-helix domain-containing protein [Caulobacterales bacterium]|nr:helix-turn-helix domain-containing protein [Caulobacterales bacterium]